MDIDLLQWMSLRDWDPKPGDWIIYNGLFIRWFGVILGINNGKIHVRYDGSPLMMILNERKAPKYKYININKMKYSRNDTYIVFRIVPGSNMPIWFISI